MRSKRRSVHVGWVIVLAGCAGSTEVVLDPRGPWPEVRSEVVHTPQEGQIQVYTQTFPGERDDVPRSLHSGYFVHADNGKQIRFVANHTDWSDEWPTLINLDPGRYLIRLVDPGLHPRVFWVTVQLRTSSVVITDGSRG